MSYFLLLYSTIDGHTRTISERLKSIIEQHNSLVEIYSIDDFQGDLKKYQRIIIGASIHYGKHHQRVYDFIKKNTATLDAVPNAFFSVNLVARKPDKNNAETNPYLKKFLRQIAWKPQEIAVFAGKLDYQRYNFWDAQIIRLIMWMTGGPTDLNSNITFTDWQQVELFGHRIATK